MVITFAGALRQALDYRVFVSHVRLLCVWRHRGAILKVSLHWAVNWKCTEPYNKDWLNRHTGETDANQVDTVPR